MKAMILAAGFGTRLLPHTRMVPKPLFPVSEKPILEILIEKLIQAGCQQIIINTHHLAEQITSFLSQKNFGIPIHVSHEVDILGTGGAVKHVEKFWNNSPFLVINSDIVTDIDLKAVYTFHLDHGFPATLVLTDHPDFNSVSTDSHGFITDFYATEHSFTSETTKRYTFTGIQVLNKEVLNFIPKEGFFNIIDAYLKMMNKGYRLKGFFSQKDYWRDIGTEERYREAVLDRMIPEAFFKAFSQYPLGPVDITLLKGDGSDRNWFRLRSESTTLIMVDHGINASKKPGEAEAFVKIGEHLHNRKVPVPHIFLKNCFSGHVFMQDLGDTPLQHAVANNPDTAGIRKLYENIIIKLCHMWMEAANGFDTSWTYQTTHYNRFLILEHECRYFTNAFLNNYSGFNIRFEDLAEEFYHLADQIQEFSCTGFMHRDFQSRNIMINGSHIYFIDFQGGRLGPLQYDLASLLIDPYTTLPETLQAQLVDFCFHHLDSMFPVLRNQFQKGFHYCTISRNLQILGAFAHLSRTKNKPWFEQYIPLAIKTLKRNLHLFFEKNEFKLLKEAIKNC